jgi:hypothetical protein
MLRIIIAILLCGILVYSKDNRLKAVAIIALLLQAYSDTRKKKEGFVSGNSKHHKSNKNIKLDKKKIDLLYEKIIGDVYIDDKCLTKEEFKDRLYSMAQIYILK